MPLDARSYIDSGSVAIVSEMSRTQLQAASSCITAFGVTRTPASLAVPGSA
ncbi:hypothetical protein D3C85_1861160 [compost metagenome]